MLIHFPEFKSVQIHHFSGTGLENGESTPHQEGYATGPP